jgi:hypothetical protein
MQQRPMIGSALLADDGSAAPSQVFDRRGDTHFERCAGLPRAPYLIAVAADRALSALPSSLYIDRSDLDTDRLGRLAIADELQRTRTELDQARQRAEATRQCAEQATLQAEQATLRADQATQRAQQAIHEAGCSTQRAEQAERTRAEWQERSETLQREYELIQGSLRNFLRGYLPRLRRHLFGQRP